MRTHLFNPFAKHSDRNLLIIGLVATIIGGFTGYFFNAVYDGALDLHFVGNIGVRETILYIAVDIITIAVFLFIAGKIFNSKTRFIDIFSTTLIARIPLYILPFFNAGNYLFSITSKMMTNLLEGKPEAVFGIETFYIICFAMITLAFIVWFFALLWNGYKVAINAKGIKPIVLFIIAVALAETISKTIILYL
ncbi:hypothetical protein [Flavobacterium sp. 3HN19-14]|uniref:hypothetical protein n=1 Tax=Flavobacterium sp. 3HN19-14 TaxID=3448133 RepID=UPI003EDEA3A2